LQRRFAVERAAALGEQCGLRIPFDVAILREQLALQLSYFFSARFVCLLFGDNDVVHVVVAEVIGRNRAQPLEDRDGKLDVLGKLVAPAIEERGKHLVITYAHGADPREMVQAGVPELHFGWRDVEPTREQALEADRDIAQADRSVAAVEERARHDADRVREIDDPCVRGRPLSRFLGNVEHHRNSAQRFGEAARARRFLANTSAPQRHCLVEMARGLAANAQLDQHEVGAVERAREIRRRRKLARPSVAIEEPATETSDHFETTNVGIL
jgi:hypothetical protein